MGKKRGGRASPATTAAPGSVSSSDQGTVPDSPLPPPPTATKKKTAGLKPSKSPRGEGEQEAAVLPPAPSPPPDISKLLRQKIAELEVQEKGQPGGGNNGVDPVVAEITRLKDPGAVVVKVDESVVLQPLLAVLQGGQEHPGKQEERGEGDGEDGPLDRAKEMCVKQSAEVQRLEESCSLLVEACLSMSARTKEMADEARLLKVEADKKREVQAKLQELCRAQAQQCKVTKAENERILSEERARKEETAARFESMMGDITTRLDEQNKKHEEKMAENARLEAKLKEVMELRRTRKEEMDKQKEERGEDISKFNKGVEYQRAVLEEEKRRTALCRERLQVDQNKLASLKEQTRLYTQRAEEYSSTAKKTVEVQQKLQERIKYQEDQKARLTGETRMLRELLEAKTAELNSLAEESKAAKVRLEGSLAGKVRLERVCRQLQAERTQRMEAARQEEGAREGRVEVVGGGD